jgi:hypothetical protein
MSAKNVQVARFRTRPTNVESLLQGNATYVGHLVAVLGEDQVAVAVPGRDGSTLPARLAQPLTHARLSAAIESRQGAVIVIDAAGQAFVIGLLEPVPLEPSAPSAEKPGAQVLEADVDGKRVRVVAEDEIVLECGKASITLRRNGRVIVRGTYVETDSAGTNRIKGAAVRIN